MTSPVLSHGNVNRQSEEEAAVRTQASAEETLTWRGILKGPCGSWYKGTKSVSEPNRKRINQLVSEQRRKGIGRSSHPKRGTHAARESETSRVADFPDLISKGPVALWHQ